MPDLSAMVPLGRRLLVRADKDGGAVGMIERPENVYERKHSGVIVAISADLDENDRRSLKVGDHIVWSPQGGTQLEGGGITGIFVLDIEEVWGRIDGVKTLEVEVDQQPLPPFALGD